MTAQHAPWHPVLLGLLVLAWILPACAGGRGDPSRGEELYRQETLGASDAPGCITCHSLEPGEVKVGPSHSDVGRRAAAIVNSSDYRGRAESAADYLRESILEPDAHVVEGFEPGVMYARFAEVLSEQQVADLVAFLLTQEGS